MGLIPFHDRKIGFWMAEKTAPPEVPPGVPVHQEGVWREGAAALVLVAADQAGQPEWALVLNSPLGASLLVPWGERLFVALGPKALLVDPAGRVTGRYDAGDDELLTAWPVEQGLLLLSRKGAHLLGPEGTARWVRPLPGEGFHLLSSEDGLIRLAAMGADDWQEIVLDPSTGAVRSPSAHQP